MGNHFGSAFALVVSWLLMVIGLGVILVLPIMWLWNWLVPTLFNGPEITFWQTVGLYFLANLLIRTNITVKNNS
jgi:hypothetical protein